MSYDARGNFNRIHCWEDDRLNNVEIASDRHDEEDNNFAEGLSMCVLRDGRAAMTGNLDLNNYRVRNLAGGTATGDAVNKGQMDTALNAKQATITGAATSITSSNLTANRALASSSSGKVIVSAVTATELSRLSGVTGNIQSQIDDCVTATITKAQKGYWQDTKNGFIVNWDKITPASNSGSVTFKKSFTSTNYVVLATYCNTSMVTSSYAHITITAKRTDGFDYICHTSIPFNYAAIGY